MGWTEPSDGMLLMLGPRFRSAVVATVRTMPTVMSAIIAADIFGFFIF